VEVEDEVALRFIHHIGTAVLREEAVGHSHLCEAVGILRPQGVLLHELHDLVQEVRQVAGGGLVGEVSGWLSHGGMVSDSGAPVKTTM